MYSIKYLRFKCQPSLLLGTTYSQVPNKHDNLFFWFYSNSLDLIRIPHLLILKTLTFHELLILFPLFVSTIFANFHGKITCFFIYFSFVLYDNLFCSFYHCTIVLCCFSNSDPPFILTPHLLKYRAFSNFLFIRTPCSFGSWKYVISLTAFHIVLPLFKATVMTHIQFQLSHSTILVHAVLKFCPFCHKPKSNLHISFHKQGILL